MDLGEKILKCIFDYPSTSYPFASLYDKLFLNYPTKLSYTDFTEVIKQLEKKKLIQIHQNASFGKRVSITKKGKMFVL